MSDYLHAVHDATVTENHICIIGEVDFHTLDPWCRCAPVAMEQKRRDDGTLYEVTILHRSLRQQGYSITPESAYNSRQANVRGEVG